MNADLPATLIDHLLCRIRNEYLEMPGLRLTRPQAQRLWGLDEETCWQVLELLVESTFLFRTGGPPRRRPGGRAGGRRDGLPHPLNCPRREA